MKEYHKIPTLFKFNQETKSFMQGVYREEEVHILRNNIWYFTEKIDGMNFRIHWDGHTLTYAGRTDKAQFNKKQIDFIEENLVNETKEILFEQVFNDKEVTIYGELFGAGIQKGGLYTDGNRIDFKAFDVYIDGLFLRYFDAEEVAHSLGYSFVDLILTGRIEDAINYVKTNKTSRFSDAELEGLIGKPIGDFLTRQGKRIIVKIKRKDIE